MIIVLNKKKDKCDYDTFYIGRGSVLGNPFDWRGSKHPQVKYRVDSREEAITKYEEYLRMQIKLKNKEICEALNQIFFKNKYAEVFGLMCFCKPLPCHGDVIKR